MISLCSSIASMAEENPPVGDTSPCEDVAMRVSYLQSKEQVTIVVVGRSAAGKTALIEKVFNAESKTRSTLSATPVTNQLHTHKVTKHGITLNIVDTIGLSQDNKAKKKQLKELSSHTNEKADLVLFCIPVGPSSRFETDTPQIMQSLQLSYGQNIWRHCLVVFTFSNLAWDCVKSQSNAVELYKHHIINYTSKFQQELKKMHIKSDITAKTIFDSIEDRPTIVTIPAGLTIEDHVLPDFETDEEKWIGALFLEMLKSIKGDSKGALLQFRYNHELLVQVISALPKYITKTIGKAIQIAQGERNTQKFADD